MNRLRRLENSLLIAMPTLEDKTFNKTVVYVYKHDYSGAKGIIINRPSSYTLQDLFERLKISTNNAQRFLEKSVLIGGPLRQESGFVLLASEDSIVLSTARKTLEEIGSEQTTADTFLVALGCVKWSPGQLENEIANNFWLTCPPGPKILFESPHTERWYAAGALLGIDLNLISPQPGCA